MAASSSASASAVPSAAVTQPPPPPSAPSIPVRPSAASRRPSSSTASSASNLPPPVLRYEGAAVNRFGVALRISTEQRERGSSLGRAAQGEGGGEGGRGGGASSCAGDRAGSAVPPPALPPPSFAASATSLPRAMDGSSSLSAPALPDTPHSAASPLSCPSHPPSAHSPPLLPSRPPRAFVSPQSSPSLSASSPPGHPPLALAAPPAVPSRPAASASHHRWVTSTEPPALPAGPFTADPRRSSAEAAAAVSSRGRAEPARPRPAERGGGGGGPAAALTGLPFPSSSFSLSSSFPQSPASPSHPLAASVSHALYATLHSSMLPSSAAAPLPPTRPLSRSVSEAVDSHPHPAPAAQQPPSSSSSGSPAAPSLPSHPGAGLPPAESASAPSASPAAPSLSSSASSSSQSSTPYASLPSQFPSSARVRVACELADTERSYVQALQSLVRLFIQPLTEALQDKRPPLTAEQLQVLFSNAQLIHSLNSSFHASIVTRLSSWAGLSEAEHKVGDLIAQFAPYFKLYSQYCSTFDASNRLLVELTTNHSQSSAAFQALLARATGAGKAGKGQAASSPPLSLSSLLIQPIQRVPRYKLLLEQLIRHTPAEHPDLPLLSTALSSISVVASHINEAIRKRESMECVMQIEERFMTKPGFLTASRVFLRQAALIKLGKSHTPRSEQFFLFNDLLASARSMMGKYLLKKKIPIDSTFMLGEHGPEAPAGPTRWGLLIFYHSCSCLSLYFADAAEKAAWQADLERCIAQAANTIQAGEKEKEKEAAGEAADRQAKEKDREREEEKEHSSTSSSSSAVVESADRSSTSASGGGCALCSSSFSLFNRRHGCRQCGRAVCADCSRSRLILNADERRPERVCDHCVLSADKAAAQPQPQPPLAIGIPPSPSSTHSLSSRSRGHPHSPSASQTAAPPLPLIDIPEHSSASHAQPLSPHPLDFASLPPYPSPSSPTHLRSPSSASLTGAAELSPPSPSSRPYPAMRLWDEATVLRWLCEPEIGFEQFADGFRRFHVDGPLLIDLSDAELRDEIGVREQLHRKRLLKLIKRLAHGPALPPSSHAPAASSAQPSSASSTAASAPPPASTNALDLQPKALWKAAYSSPSPSTLPAVAASRAAAAGSTQSPSASPSPAPKLPEGLARDIHQTGTGKARAAGRAAAAAGSSTASASAGHSRNESSSSSSSSPSSTPAMPKRAAPSLPQRQRNTAILYRPHQPPQQRVPDSPLTANAGPPWALPTPSSSSVSSAIVRCGKCARANEASLRFCVSCGSYLATAAAAPSAPSAAAPRTAAGSRRGSAAEPSPSPPVPASASASTSTSRRTSGEKVSHLAAQLAQQAQVSTPSSTSSSSSRSSSVSSRRPSLSNSGAEGGARERRGTGASIAQRAAAFQQQQ